MYRQKSVIFTIGKTLYIQAGARYKRKEMVSSIYSQNTTVWARYKRKERVLYKENTYNNAYI